MSSSAPALAGVPSALAAVFSTLMDLLDVAVQIDDLTGVTELLRELELERIDDLAAWLEDHPIIAERLRGAVECVAVNQAAVKMYQAESAEQLIQHLSATNAKARNPDFLKLVAALRDGAADFTGTFCRENPDGQQISGQVDARFVEANGSAYVCYVARETRVMQHLEDQLQRIRQLHTLAVNATDTGCWDISYARNYIRMDATSHRLLGYPDGELPTDPAEYTNMIHPDDRQASMEAGARLASGETDEFRVQHRLMDASGTWRWFHAHGRAVERNPDGTTARMVGTFRLIDREWKARRQLQLEKEVFAIRTAGESLSETFTFLCRSLETIWPGTRVAINLYNAQTQRFFSRTAPSVPDAFLASFTGERQAVAEAMFTDAVESRAPVCAIDLAGSSPAPDERRDLEEWGMRYWWILPAITPNGRPAAALSLLAASPGTLSSEDIQLLEKLALNIAILVQQDRQDRQQQQLERQLQIQDKFQSVGKLASGIAHDFNNLLTIIAGHAEILQMQLSSNPRAVATCEKIEHAVQLATSMCRQMLTLAGEARVQSETVDLNDVVCEVCDVLRPGFTNGDTLRTEFAVERAALNGDRSMLSQLVMNLVTNAHEASKPGGLVDVRVSSGSLEFPVGDLLISESLPEQTERENLRWICLTVRDDGGGMTEETRRRMFDPFYTTRDSGRGLGLPTVVGIVRRHRGALHLDARPKSTTFRVYLPERGAPVTDWRPAAEPPPFQESNVVRVLLADDASAVRDSVADMLRTAGFETRTFTGGEQLLEFMDDITADDVLLLDQNMPGLNGSETYDRLRAGGILNPVCFVTSAAGSDALQRIILADDACWILEKPVQISTLRNVILRLMSRNRE